MPDYLAGAIEKVVRTDPPQLLKALEDLKEDYRRSGPVYSDFTDDARVDAYMVRYLLRNWLVPRIALRDLAFCGEIFEQWPDKIRVLDLGSGPGAVVLGLLDLFNNLNTTPPRLEIECVDKSTVALERLEELMIAAGLASPDRPVRTTAADLTEVDALDAYACLDGLFDLVFAVGLFNEIDMDKAAALLRWVSSRLSDNGVFVVACAQNGDYAKKIIPGLSWTARCSGLSVFYPCPPNGSCEEGDLCWVWRKHIFDQRTLKVGGQPFLELNSSWLVLSKRPTSIFETFSARRPDLEWGVVCESGTKCKLCTRDGKRPYFHRQASCTRGSIVGVRRRYPTEIDEYFDLSAPAATKWLNFRGKEGV